MKYNKGMPLYAVFPLLYREDVLSEAWKRVKANKGYIEEVEETSEGGFGGATTTIVRTAKTSFEAAKTESVSSLFCCLNLTNQKNSIK